MSTTNLEEAATVAAEFISSLDNLPNEVQHLLAEIKYKDIRAQELQQEINKESAKYIRHSLRALGPQTPTLTPKDQAIPQLVRAHYAEIDTLSDEKIALAERIVRLVARAQVRLEADLGKVMVLQGEEPVSQPTVSHNASAAARTPITQVLDDLRTAANLAINNTVVATPAPYVSTTAAAAPPPAKRPRIAGTIKMPSPAPVPISTARAAAATAGTTNTHPAATQRTSRLSHQVHPRQSPSRATRRVTASVGPDPDEDAEGEDEPEDAAEDLGEVEEDKEIYCFCRKLSYGEMIACDNPDCRYQWFHLPCVNLKAPLPERWFCSECGGPGMERRKGRKK